MPELPEVETVRRSLLELVPHKKIAAVEIFKPSSLELGDEGAFAELCGHEFADIGRRGKYLIFCLDDGRRMVVHLRMTGKLLYHTGEQLRQKHDHARFAFADGSELVFNDIRAFGRLWLTDEAGLANVSGLNSLGMEPIEDGFSAAYWQEKIRRRPKAMVKAVLLDQHVVAGLGNIYADEVLFRAGVHPERQIQTLTSEENERLAAAMREILLEAISKRGTTFRDYVDANNERGSFQDSLRVFQRKDSPCVNCGTKIQRTKVAGRTSYYCPNCQRPPETSK
jgi:formamidopyrimidine-DNA glycosylase